VIVLLASAIFSFAVTARAADFVVNDPTDVVDAVPGDGVCETGSGTRVCTLRAAIQEANAAAGADTVTLPAG
jgi:CSLREA domain-containing protein